MEPGEEGGENFTSTPVPLIRVYSASNCLIFAVPAGDPAANQALALVELRLWEGLKQLEMQAPPPTSEVCFQPLCPQKNGPFRLLRTK